MMRENKFYIYLLLIILISSSCGSSKKLARQQKVDKVISTARSYLGTPYKWGGLNRSGMDCSGLLFNSFRTIGWKIPRTSDEQQELGKKVKMKNLQPGDIVFFATGKRKRKVTHAGLVTRVVDENEIYFIHSSSSRGVVESNIYQEYYIKRFRKGRRIL